ncbi:hypothetical protein EJF36_12860 [Bacillus sp. HMF5848]|uniref:RQC-minor-2 family DNA-binding protein n=1 Tax=Bacillus sp. HMF5848 TaxID=2495421 RepID=UPI000F7B0692|nr:RQC-minor-2 family DNA-binding protein [Bacillus sp. HMF5848]RSK27692.1 hypothetical protein EJF36_12860 [Bacillus sp. HMF5848]
MTIPKQLSYTFDPYSALVFVPVGRRFKDIRSIGHKEERATLSRIQEAVANEFSARSKAELRILQHFMQTNEPYIPVPIYKQEYLYPMLIKPEMFLWKKHSLQRGIPIQSELFYKKEIKSLSAEQLTKHVHDVVEDYLFCSQLSEHPRHDWLAFINNAYVEHPFIKLAASKENVIQAVEAMNKSSILASLKYPDDIAYWRHRVEIVLRPYREIPFDWQWQGVCLHEKELVIHAKTRKLTCTCHICKYHIDYVVDDNYVVLPNEVDLDQAIKRIATIESQFNDIASKNERLLKTLLLLQDIKIKLRNHTDIIDEIVTLKKSINKLDIPMHPLLDCYKAIKIVAFPKQQHESKLLWLSQVHIPDITILKKVEEWHKLLSFDMTDELESMRVQLQKLKAENEPRPTDIIIQIKNYSMTLDEIQRIIVFLQNYHQEMSLHLFTQVLKGETTNKIRGLGLHNQSVFGLLADWPVKYVTKAIMEMEKDDYIKKQNKGYIA